MIQIISNIITSGALGVFLYFFIKGLYTKIGALEATNKQQNETLKVMEKRIEETEKIGGKYRNLLSDIPNDIENYKKFVSQTKDEIIFELRNENERSKKQLNEAKQIIESSGDSQEKINMYLASLKKLMSPKKDRMGHDKDKNLKALSEYNGHKIENSIDILIKSKTFEEFVQFIGLQLVVTDDPTFWQSVFMKDKLPNGEKINTGFGFFGIDGNQFVANELMFVDSKMLAINQVEYYQIKEEEK